MKRRLSGAVVAVGTICLLFGFGVIGAARSQSTNSSQKNGGVGMVAKGTFEVKIVPLASDDKTGDATMGRMSIDKQFHGDLEGTSKGQMLTAGSVVKGSAGYVAMERVTGTLQGHSGSFTLQHTGTMNRGAFQLSVSVVPDSGTGQLEGLAGSMNIIIAEGKHSYEFTYTLPEGH
jgi:hypothetical protein